MLTARKVRKPVRKARKAVRKARKPVRKARRAAQKSSKPARKRKVARKAASSARAMVRSTATVASVVRRIQRELGLPEGAVSLSMPTGRRARGDKTLGKLRAAWEK